jgi:hypothetical protein
MKDKQRFISSVIVSLLAGFIYYQFGQDIQKDVESSIKAVISSNDLEYISPDCGPFTSITKKSFKDATKKKSKFYIKKNNTVEFKTKNVTIPADDLFADYVSHQANQRRPVADKNIDFTAELKDLIKNDGSGSDPKPGRELRINKNTGNGKEVADTKSLNSMNNLLHKNAVEFDLGNGFEYNIIIDGNSSQPKNSLKGKKNKSQSNKNSNTNSNKNSNKNSKESYYSDETYDYTKPSIISVETYSSSESTNSCNTYTYSKSDNSGSSYGSSESNKVNKTYKYKESKVECKKKVNRKDANRETQIRVVNPRADIDIKVNVKCEDTDPEDINIPDEDSDDDSM